MVYIIFLICLLEHSFWVHVRIASMAKSVSGMFFLKKVFKCEFQSPNLPYSDDAK